MIYPSKYQPLKFTQADETNCLTCGNDCVSFIQQMFDNDSFPFQFQVSPCDNAPNLVSNWDFEQGSLGWDVFQPVQFSSSGATLAAGGASIIQTGFLNPGQYYRLTLSTYAEGLPLLRIINIFEDIEFYPSAGQTQTFYVRSLHGNIGFQRRDNSLSPSVYVEIQSVIIEPIEMPTITVRDMDDTLLDMVVGAEYEPPYLNVLYTPNTAAKEAGVFQFRVGQYCSEEEPPEFWYSEPIKIIAANDCLIQVGGCGNTNLWGSLFIPFVRIDSKLLADRTPVYDRFTTRRTSGRWRNNYTRVAKGFTFTADYVPEHLRDFLYVLPALDQVVIRRGYGVLESYFCDEEPDAPEFQDGSDELARVSLPLVYKEDLIESIYVQECNVLLPPVVLGSRNINLIIEAGTNTFINAE